MPHTCEMCNVICNSIDKYLVVEEMLARFIGGWQQRQWTLQLLYLDKVWNLNHHKIPNTWYKPRKAFILSIQSLPVIFAVCWTEHIRSHDALLFTHVVDEGDVSVEFCTLHLMMMMIFPHTVSSLYKKIFLYWSMPSTHF